VPSSARQRCAAVVTGGGQRCHTTQQWIGRIGTAVVAEAVVAVVREAAIELVVLEAAVVAAVLEAVAADRSAVVVGTTAACGFAAGSSASVRPRQEGLEAVVAVAVASAAAAVGGGSANECRRATA